MKPWRMFFDDVGKFLLARKPNIIKTKTAIDTDTWHITRISALQDFVGLNKIKEELSSKLSKKSEDKRTLSEVSRTEASKKFKPDTAADEVKTDTGKKKVIKIDTVLDDVRGSIEKNSKDTAELTRIVTQAEIYAIEGNLAYRKALQVRSALQNILNDPGESAALYNSDKQTHNVCEIIQRLEPSLKGQRETEGIRSYLESILPFTKADTRNNIAGTDLNAVQPYESPETYYYMRLYNTGNRSRAYSIHESGKARRGSTVAPSPTAQPETTPVNGLEMPTFANTIGWRNVLRHPLAAIGYAMDGLTRTVFEYPAELTCRAINGLYNGLYSAGNWIANRLRAFTNQPTVTADPNDSTALRRFKVATHCLLIYPPVLYGIRALSLAASKAIGSAGGVTDKQFADITRMQTLHAARAQQFEEEKKRRPSHKGPKPLVRGKSAPDLFAKEEEKMQAPQTPAIPLPGVPDDVEMISLASAPERPDTVSPFNKTGSEGRFNTFSPRVPAADTSTQHIHQHLLIDTNTDDHNVPTPQGTLRSARQSSVAPTPTGFSTRYNTWISEPPTSSDDDRTPQPSPKPTTLLNSPQHPLGRARTVSPKAASPAGPKQIPVARTMTTQITRIEEGSRNNSDDHTPTPPKTPSPRK